MTVGEVWTLVRPGAAAEVVGEIYVDDHDFPWFFGAFTALDGFAEIRPLFVAEAALGERIDEAYAEWEAAYLRIRAAVDLVHPSGRTVAEFLLHIDGDQAGFRWSDTPFDTSVEAGDAGDG